MLAAAPLLVAALFAALASRLPRALLVRYYASFRDRHGVGVQIGLVVLGATITSMLVATLLRPGHALMELVDAAVVLGLAIAALADLYLFARSR